MTDIAQLRKALVEHAEYGGIGIGAYETNILAAAARVLLTLREAGALIIVPDENGNWPRWTRELGLWPSMVRLVLDALRDAKPDGETQ